MNNGNGNAKATASASGGAGFCSLLTIAFIVLKLTGVIAWSWWWVLAPTWIPLAILLAILIFIGMFLFLFDSA